MELQWYGSSNQVFQISNMFECICGEPACAASYTLKFKNQRLVTVTVKPSKFGSVFFYEIAKDCFLNFRTSGAIYPKFELLFRPTRSFNK